MEPEWDEMLTSLANRPGMYVLAPRFLGVDAYLAGFSHGRSDGVTRGFQEWFSKKFPVEGGYANPIAHAVVIAQDLFGQSPEDLDEDQTRAAIDRLCSLMRQYLEAER